MKVEVYFTAVDYGKLVVKTGVFKNRLEIAVACMIYMNNASDVDSAMMYLEGQGFKLDDNLSIGFDKVMSLYSENQFIPELIYINRSLQWGSDQTLISKF